MAITSLADVRASLRQRIVIHKGPPTTPLGSLPVITAVWLGGGSPPPGGAPGNTANGVVPTSSTTGAPNIDFSSGNGYLTGIEANCTGVGGRLMLYDRLFHCGSYAGTSGTTTLSSQPSFSSRIPGGTNYDGLQIWAEVNASGTNAPTVACTYTNSVGGTGRSSGSTTISGYLTGKVAQLSLQAGDSGVQTIESVVITGSFTGSLNFFIARPLWVGRLEAGDQTSAMLLDRAGMAEVWPASCLSAIFFADSSASFSVDLSIEIASK